VKAGNNKHYRVTPHMAKRLYQTRKEARLNMSQHSDATGDIYTIMDKDRQRTVAGFTAQPDPDMQAKVEEVLKTAKKMGITLSEVQSAFRQA
jgi:hypothetical protein